uniref:Uncharacterized protein n=1 Tax=Glossina palpalis gambiensis TaxID=67801 RepID=A0A1B0B7C8_9MUSC
MLEITKVVIKTYLALKGPKLGNMINVNESDVARSERLIKKPTSTHSICLAVVAAAVAAAAAAAAAGCSKVALKQR